MKPSAWQCSWGGDLGMGTSLGWGFPTLQRGFFPPGRLELDLKDRNRDREGVGGDLRASLRCAAPTSNAASTPKKDGMGRFKDQITPWVLPRLEALLVFLAG